MARNHVKPDMPSHSWGTPRGEDAVKRGPEPGREEGHRTARDATSINAEKRRPIDPRMPDLPPS